MLVRLTSSIRFRQLFRMASASNLRSDTFTQPCAEMRKLMSEAVVGDDVYKEDPTVNLLQERCAKLFGKEAALFVVSGTMGNLLSVMTHCDGRGEEFIVGNKSHIFLYEQGNFAHIGGVSANVLKNQPDGTLFLDDIQFAIRDHSDEHCPRTRLICLENTQNVCGGRVLSLDYLKQVRKLADNHGIRVHLDGARLMNASVATGVPLDEIAATADSLYMCFSKGLGCPVGSIIAGTKDFIFNAHRLRKSLGGAWRQAGVLAAPCLYAIENARSWIAVDHQNAKQLAERIAKLPSNGLLSVQPSSVDTNMFMVAVPQGRAQEFSDLLGDTTRFSSPPVQANPETDDSVRFVTHRDFPSENIDSVISRIEEVIAVMLH